MFNDNLKNALREENAKNVCSTSVRQGCLLIKENNLIEFISMF